MDETEDIKIECAGCGGLCIDSFDVDLPLPPAQLEKIKHEPPEVREGLEKFLRLRMAAGPYYCNTCLKFVTNEGLLLKTLDDHPRKGCVTREEVGRGEVVIFREIKGPDRTESDIALLLSELAKALKMRSSPDHRLDAEFNARTAIGRLLRYFDEEDPLRVSLSEPQKKLVRVFLKMLSVEESKTIPVDDPEDILAVDKKLQSQVDDYARRKRETRHLFSISTDDAISISTLDEAREAYRWGLFRATLAVCRAALEDTVSECLKVLKETASNGKFGRDPLEARIDDLYKRLGTHEKKDSAHRVRGLGNEALHNFERISSETALEGLRITFTLLPFLVLRSRKLMSN